MCKCAVVGGGFHVSSIREPVLSRRPPERSDEGDFVGVGGSCMCWETGGRNFSSTTRSFGERFLRSGSPSDFTLGELMGLIPPLPARRFVRLW